MSGSFLTHVGFSIDVPFTLLAVDGSIDTTTVANVTSVNPNVNVGIRPDNNRMAFIDGKSAVDGANVDVSAMIGGDLFHSAFLVEVDPAEADQRAVVIGATASVEYPTPSIR